MSLRTLESLGDLSGKTVLLRADLNVPVSKGEITDDGRVRASLPTIRSLLDAGARVVAMSHLGRPDGAPDPAFSLAPVAVRLAELLGEEVAFPEPGDARVSLLENLRFDPRETSKDDSERGAFAAELAARGDVVVSDGFGAVHRKHASVYDLEKLLPSAAGLLIVAELDVLERLTERPEKPYTVVLGGAKVSDKLGVIDALLPRVDRLLIGGGMMFTFLKAQGHPIGASLLDADGLDAATGYLREAAERGVELVLPTDAVVAERFAADASSTVAPADAIESTEFGAAGLGLDIGPETAARFAELIASSRTVFWNGPMGVFEFPAFAEGTRAVAQALSEVDGLGVVGGGDSAAAVRQLGFSDDDFGHVSTGGGASLEFLEGSTLPGLEVLGWQR
ncbi:MAG: phosphoglycerate kinase [Microbacteriaceae bacterium]|nr:phosphoglycerate kinase [Microbacteriaceae bacterium]